MAVPSIFTSVTRAPWYDQPINDYHKRMYKQIEQQLEQQLKDYQKRMYEPTEISAYVTCKPTPAESSKLLLLCEV